MKKNAPSASEKAKGKGKKKNAKKKTEISYHRQPDNLELHAWQFALRKQFGETNPFEITNNGTHPVYSDFTVFSPTSKSNYRVCIRSPEIRFGKMPVPTLFQTGNFCACHDFKTNRLGICKHISAVMATLVKKRGNKKILKEGFRQPHSSLYLDYFDGRHIRLSIGTEKEAEFSAFAAKYFDESGRLLPEALPRFVEIIREARDIHDGFRCYPDAFDFILQQRDALSRQTKMKAIFPKGTDSAYFNNVVKATLFQYQKTGIHFAVKAGRCLIADEMGLGKTIQAIAAAEIYRRELQIQKVLIVCPTSLKYQWKAEIEKFTDSTALVVEGMPLARKRIYETSEANYLILSYHTVANDAEVINRMDADLVILDEAQRIKNFRTKVAGQIKKIITPYCFVLTGTPIENKLEELYSIMQFVDQFRLPPLYRFLHQYQISNETGKVTGYKNLKQIAENLSDCMIRRTKKEVLTQLPKRRDKMLYVPMTKEQMQTHQELADTVARLVHKWQKQHFLSETDRRRLILSLSQMRMVCDSTFILDQRTRFDTKVAELMCILEEALADPEQKVVVFSQWERMTRIVAQELEERGIGFASLHGGVESRSRGKLIDDFTNDPECRIFLSTDAGGTGLNLQRASLLINLDIPWNPAVLEQRIARIYRLGQANNVEIINMVSLQTIEHRMLGVLEFKADMAKGVLDPEGEDTIFLSESRFKKFMETVEALTPDEEVTIVAENEGIQPNEATFHPPILDENEDNTDDLEMPAPRPSSPEPAARPERADSTANPKDDIAPTTPSTETAPKQPATLPREPSTAEMTAAKTISTPQDLVKSGVTFLSGLAETLSSVEKTQALVSSLVQKDESTGQTYLKIPIEDQTVVENAMRVLGSLFAGFGKP